MDGDDLRRLPLSMRRTNLARLLRGRPEGIFINPFEQGEIGPDLFLKACEFGLEGLVSKHRDRPYQSGRSKHWIKVKNRKHQGAAPFLLRPRMRVLVGKHCSLSERLIWAAAASASLTRWRNFCNSSYCT
jgi:bifunctional non-homologous end joining protein LigD